VGFSKLANFGFNVSKRMLVYAPKNSDIAVLKVFDRTVFDIIVYTKLGGNVDEGIMVHYFIK
jgi:hypothetical protein